MKGEIGDIIFMAGHAAMLAAPPEMLENNGQSFVRLKTYTTTTNDGFIEQTMDFFPNGYSKTRGWSGFEGYGQMHGTTGQGDPNLLPKPIE